MVRVVSIKDLDKGIYQYAVNASDWYGEPQERQKKPKIVSKPVFVTKKLTIGKKLS